MEGDEPAELQILFLNGEGDGLRTDGGALEVGLRCVGRRILDDQQAAGGAPVQGQDVARNGVRRGDMDDDFVGIEQVFRRRLHRDDTLGQAPPPPASTEDPSTPSRRHRVRRERRNRWWRRTVIAGVAPAGIASGLTPLVEATVGAIVEALLAIPARLELSPATFLGVAPPESELANLRLDCRCGRPRGLPPQLKTVNPNTSAKTIPSDVGAARSVRMAVSSFLPHNAGLPLRVMRLDRPCSRTRSRCRRVATRTLRAADSARMR